MTTSSTLDTDIQVRVARPETAPFRLLDLPPELRSVIFGYALTTSTGKIFLFEENGKLRIGMTASGIMPAGGFNEAFSSWTRHKIELSKPYNQLQYVNRQLREETRGIELKQNELQCNAYTFDTFTAQIKTHPHQKDWYNNVCTVSLLGKYPIGHQADENLLHGILRFGRAHDRARVRVYVPDWTTNQ